MGRRCSWHGATRLPEVRRAQLCWTSPDRSWRRFHWVSPRPSASPVCRRALTLTVRAGNAAGASTASNPVTLTFPGACSGPPLAPANFLAYKSGNTIFVVWLPLAAVPRRAVMC